VGPSDTISFGAVQPGQSPAAGAAAGAAAPAGAPVDPTAVAPGAAPVDPNAAPPGGGAGAVDPTAAAGAPPGVPQSPLVPGSNITVPGTASHELREMLERAMTLDKRHLPYLWGGGHQGGILDVTATGPVDCSGAVSAVLGLEPRVSGAYEKWGLPGPGQHVTIYANEEHILMEINGHFFGTSAANPGGGAGWIPREHIGADYLARFVARHPPGL
jgi:hypothetical protein